GTAREHGNRNEGGATSVPASANPSTAPGVESLAYRMQCPYALAAWPPERRNTGALPRARWRPTRGANGDRAVRGQPRVGCAATAAGSGRASLPRLLRP